MAALALKWQFMKMGMDFAMGMRARYDAVRCLFNLKAFAPIG
jgi:hypothetical protein